MARQKVLQLAQLLYGICIAPPLICFSYISCHFSTYYTSAKLAYLASAGDIGGIMGKKFGLGKSFALPVMRQNDDMSAGGEVSFL